MSSLFVVCFVSVSFGVLGVLFASVWLCDGCCVVVTSAAGVKELDAVELSGT